MSISRKQVVTAGVLGLVLAFGLIAGTAYFLPISANQKTTTITSIQVESSTQTSSSGQSSSSQTTQSQPTQSQSSQSQTTQSQTTQSQTTQSQTIQSQSSESQSTKSQTTQSQTTQSQTTQSQSSQSQTTQSQTTQTSAELGTIAVLLTDPPTLPVGVTAVYVTYSNVAVHVSGAGNQSGWFNSNTTGTINLVKLVNVSSTIATVKVATGVYNELRFNVSSALVTYNAKNYTAFVTLATLVVPIPGGIPVNATTSSAAIIDMHPTVVNIGSNSTPEFIISNAASGYCIPPQNVTGDMDHRGYQIDLTKTGWWQQISESYTANVSISSATLKAGSFSVTITNTGSTPVNLTALFIAPLGNECPTATSTTTTTTSTSSSSTSSQTSTTTTTTRHNQPGGSGGGGPPHHGPISLPVCLTGSANYLVLDNGTIVPISAALPMAPRPAQGHVPESWALFGKTGYELAAGKSVTLTYTGSITFGLGIRSSMVSPGVIPGDQYDITVIGQQALAATVVVAS